MIRKALLKDQDDILKIYDDAKAFIKSYNSPQWQDGYPNIETFIDDLKNERLYVYDIDGTAVACASFYHYEKDYEDIYEGNWLTDGTNYMAVHTIATLDSYRGHGISKQFFDYLFENFEASSIRIDTHELNKPMIKILTKVGFEYCGIVYLGEKKDKKRLAFERLRK